MVATAASSERERLIEFVRFCQKLKGNERKEAPTFLDRFFKAFGHPGAMEAGAEFEASLTKGSKQGGTGFADLVWRSRMGTPGVVIEMKSRGENLAKHYAQVERYWMRIAPNRPRYALLCNFDEFWIFDFENQVDEPVDRIVIDENLPDRARALSFMQKGGLKPIFQNNQVEVTKRTARRMGELYQELYKRGKKNDFRAFNEEQLQRFVLQCVMALFSEDRGLLPQDLFVSLIQECLDGKGSTYDILGGLFREMNVPGTTPAGRYKGVEYFNGGLFATIAPIELTPDELRFLDVCAKDNWRNVRPSIFGNIFEGASNPEERRAHGIHFTSEADIRQIVRPTISDYWEDRISSAGTIAELNTLQLELQAYRVLDPACGCGNFLYVAYQEMKRLENLLLSRITERKRSDKGQMQIGFVTPLQFFGMDINPFAVQLARVTMMIARKIAIDKYNLMEPALPLDTIDGNIVRKDALFSEWVPVDAVIGNPPFLGGRNLRKQLGHEYVEEIYKAFPAVEGQADFCVFWFRKTVDHLEDSGRAGLVGTNSITQNVSRKASLDYILKNGGVIHSAISSQEWSGDAAVHVSFVNWAKQPSSKLFLDNKEVQFISSSLKTEISVTSACKLLVNKNLSFEACQLAGKGFIVSKEEARQWIKANPKSREILKPMIDGRGLTYPLEPLSWVIDFNDMSFEKASEYEQAFNHVKERIKPERDKNRRDARKINWWKYGERRPAMRKALDGLTCYFAVPKVSKFVIFVPVDIAILPCEANMVIASDDFYILGILTSNIHRLWVKAQSSTLEDRIRYTNTTCFETFPFPQRVNPKLTMQIRSTTQDLHKYRTEQMQRREWGITQLYNHFFNEPSSQLYKLHAKLDRLVLQAYGFNQEDDLLARLLELNLELADREKRGLPVVGPSGNN